VEPSRYAADGVCRGCRGIRYCPLPATCQRADWARHKAACRAAAAAAEAAAREGALVAVPRARPPPPAPPAPRRLCTAAAAGDLKRVEELLQLGADVNATEEDGQRITPVMLAAAFGHAAVLRTLLACPGVAVNAQNTQVPTSKAVKQDGMTALHQASIAGEYDCVVLLLAAPGVQVNLREKDNDLTPLGAARLLLSSRKINHKGKPPASALDYKRVIKALEAAGGVE